MNTPLVSVCINAYNTEKYIQQAIKSVLDQTYENLQVIVVDDASTDNTLDVIKQSFSDERLEIYSREENRHISYSCNEAIAYAKGEYIFHLDADDTVADSIVEKEVSFLENNKDFGACFTALEIIDRDGNIADSSYDDLRKLFRVKQKTQAEFINHFFYNSNCLSHTGSMIRKSVLDEIGGHDYSMSYLHDFDLWTRIILKHPIYVFEEPLAFYRRGDDINHSVANENSLTILNFETSTSIYRMINDCPDNLFLEAFHDSLKLNCKHTHEEAELEKAFLLLNVNFMPYGNNLLGIMKFQELFKEKKYVDLALEKFNFSIYDLLKYEEKKLFYNAAETQSYLDSINGLQHKTEHQQSIIDNLNLTIDNLKSTTSDLHDTISSLQNQIGEYQKVVDHYEKTIKKTVEYHILKAIKKAVNCVKHFSNSLSNRLNRKR